MFDFTITDYGKRHGMTQEHLGFIPMFLSEHNPLSAKEQIDAGYAHGGGWRSFKGFVLQPDGETIQYSGDQALKPLASGTLHGQKLFYYDSSWFAIVDPDGTYDVARLD